MDDSISRQWLMECVEEGWIKFDTQEDENRFVHLIRDIAPSAQSTMGQVNQGDTVNERSVKFLDLFAKTYCRDKSVTADLKFRCSECKFEMPDKKCLVKCMARKLCPDYKDFGSMGGSVMDDLISRQAAIDAVNTALFPKINTAKDAEKALRNLPSAQQWIPTSERLPKVREWVLCQCRAGIMDVLRLTEDGSWNKNYPHAEYMSGFVIAWMPLPEQWKGEQE